jgi:hypothetical protein
MSTRRVEAQSIVPITGRRFCELRVRLLTGQTISIPVWFVLEGEKLYLLPVQGLGTQ